VGWPVPCPAEAWPPVDWPPPNKLPEPPDVPVCCWPPIPPAGLLPNKPPPDDV